MAAKESLGLRAVVGWCDKFTCLTHKCKANGVFLFAKTDAVSLLAHTKLGGGS